MTAKAVREREAIPYVSMKVTTIALTESSGDDGAVMQIGPHGSCVCESG